MWVGRVSGTDCIKVEEAGIGNALLAKGVNAFEGIVGHKPCCAEGNCSRACCDLVLAGGVLLYLGIISVWQREEGLIRTDKQQRAPWGSPNSLRRNGSS